MHWLLLLHIICVALWLGCILVEAIVEHSIEPSPAMRRFISRTHWTIDKTVEIPAFLGVLVTGATMLATAPMGMGGLLWGKVALGLTAIAANVACVWLVRRRLGPAERGDFTTWEKLDHLQHKLGAVVLLTLLVALVLGGVSLTAKA